MKAIEAKQNSDNLRAATQAALDALDLTELMQEIYNKIALKEEYSCGVHLPTLVDRYFPSASVKQSDAIVTKVINRLITDGYKVGPVVPGLSTYISWDHV